VTPSSLPALAPRPLSPLYPARPSQVKEIKNGRLAMIAISGITHHYFLTGKGPIEFITQVATCPPHTPQWQLSAPSKRAATTDQGFKLNISLAGPSRSPK
jgi:hypothetical protein